MAGRKRSGWEPTAVAGRIVWGHGGFKGAMRRLWRELLGPRTVASVRVDPDGDKLKTLNLRKRPDGTFEYRPPHTRRRRAGRR